MALAFVERFARRRTRSQRLAQMRVPFRNVREVAGTTRLHPDWPKAQVRVADVAVVLHLTDPTLLDSYLDVIARVTAPVDLFIVLPAALDSAIPSIESNSAGIREVLVADPVADGLYQLTSLINSGRLVGYRTVVRHVARGRGAFERFNVIELDSIDALVHADLDRAGVFVPEGKGASSNRDLTYRVSQLLKRVNTRFRGPDLRSRDITLSTVALRGAALEFLRPLRIDHQDFHVDYAKLVHEGQAIEYLKPARPDRFAGRAVELTLLYLIDTAGLRIEDVASATAAPPAHGVRAQAWAIYHPGLASAAHTKDATWPRLSASMPMFLGQQLPPAPLEFANPELPADRARQVAVARSVGVSGFLVQAEWTGNGFDAEPFFESLEVDEDFPWAIVVRNSPGQRINPYGTIATIAPWVDTGAESYAVQGARIAELTIAPSYLRVDGRPVVIVEDLSAIADPEAFTSAIRAAVAATSGVQPWLAVVQSELTAPRSGDSGAPAGLDAVIQVPPQISDLRQRLRIGGRFAGFTGPVINLAARSTGTTVPVEARNNASIIPGAFVGFDTTPELRSQGTVGYNWNIGSFRRMLESAVRSVAWRDENARIVVINSWNGWSNMSQLEPGYHRGESYLSAVRDTLIL